MASQLVVCRSTETPNKGASKNNPASNTHITMWAYTRGCDTYVAFNEELCVCLEIWSACSIYRACVYICEDRCSFNHADLPEGAEAVANNSGIPRGHWLCQAILRVHCEALPTYSEGITKSKPSQSFVVGHNIF